MLSARNNWTDENGRIYIIYSIEKIAEDLFYSRATIMRMMDELEHLGLIERRKQGLGTGAEVNRHISAGVYMDSVQ